MTGPEFDASYAPADEVAFESSFLESDLQGFFGVVALEGLEPEAFAD